MDTMFENHRLAGLVVLLTIVLLAGYKYYTDPLKHVPGPLYARFTNLPLKLAVLSGRRIYHVHELHQRYGPVVRIAPNELAIADAQAHKKIHYASSGFVKSQWYHDMVNGDRDGIFAMNGKEHAARRKLLSRAFSKTHLKQHWESHVQGKVRLAVARIREKLTSGPVDILQWWSFMASDVSTHLMFGESFHALEQEVVSDYIRMLTLALMGSGIGVELPWIRWIGSKIPLRACRDIFGLNERLRSYAQRAVDNMKADQGTTNIFAGMMAEAEKGESLDEVDIRVEAQNLIVAGTDTTSNILTYLVWAVLSRPDLQQRLEQEVQSLPEDFNDADAGRLELMNAVIEETLRLYGAAPGGLPRAVPPGGTEMGDFFVPGGTIVTTQAYTFHRDPAAFPEPLSFIPERWMASEKSNQYVAVDGLTKRVFTPFGTGPRTCLGIHLAYTELRLATATFFRDCAGARIAPGTTPASMEMENYFLIAPKAHSCTIVKG